MVDVVDLGPSTAKSKHPDIRTVAFSDCESTPSLPFPRQPPQNKLAKEGCTYFWTDDSLRGVCKRGARRTGRKQPKQASPGARRQEDGSRGPSHAYELLADGGYLPPLPTPRKAYSPTVCMYACMYVFVMKNLACTYVYHWRPWVGRGEEQDGGENVGGLAEFLLHTTKPSKSIHVLPWETRSNNAKEII